MGRLPISIKVDLIPCYDAYASIVLLGNVVAPSPLLLGCPCAERWACSCPLFLCENSMYKASSSELCTDTSSNLPCSMSSAWPETGRPCSCWSACKQGCEFNDGPAVCFDSVCAKWE